MTTSLSPNAAPAAAAGIRYVPGPTYTEMYDPRLLPAGVRERAEAARADELDPYNLFNITWRNSQGNVRYVVLPPALTRCKANILVMIGCGFPSGSHKVGPAYSTLAENESTGKIHAGMTMVGPSTGNFGIGVSYVSRLKGYRALVVMPEGMSAERYERIKKYGGVLDLTPGSESDVILVLERVEEVKRNPNNFILAQFELMPNYRFHRHVTGQSVLEAAAQVGNGKIAAFVSAPGSAGTLAAGDAVKKRFADAKIVAVEPKECSTLFDGGQGSHRIEGIGDKMVVLIHNTAQTDFVLRLCDDDTVKGLRVLTAGKEFLSGACGVPGLSCTASAGTAFPGADGKPDVNADLFKNCFGISSVGNILAAIRTAQHLGLGEGDNIVTVATDGFDRYPSVMEELAHRTAESGGGVLGGKGSIDDARLTRWLEDLVGDGAFSAGDFLDVRTPAQQARLHDMKKNVWTRFGYEERYIDSMRGQDFWDAEYEKVASADAAIAEYREASGVWPPA